MDEDKAAANLAAHGVTFDEALGVFADPNSVELEDVGHADRFDVIGFSAKARLLFVVATERGDLTRLISARRATPAEARRYEEG